MKTIILGTLILYSSLVPARPGSGQLTATIIGSGSPAYNENRANASVLISDGNTRILVDMGNGTQANLERLGMNTPDFSALLFTHHHLDHNEEFVPVLIHSLLGRHEFQITGPPNTVKFVEANLELYAEDIAYRLGRSGRTLADRRNSIITRDIEGGESFDIGDISVSTLKVPHAIHTIAYRFDLGDESIVITGDLTYSDALPELARDADFMIIDSGGMIFKNAVRARRNTGNRRGSVRERAHLNLSESSQLASRSNVKNLVYTHFAPGEVDQEASLIEIRKNYDGNVIFGTDLMVLKNVSDDPQTVSTETERNYPIVDTAQEKYYGNSGEIPRPLGGMTTGDFPQSRRCTH